MAGAASTGTQKTGTKNTKKVAKNLSAKKNITRKTSGNSPSKTSISKKSSTGTTVRKKPASKSNTSTVKNKKATTKAGSRAATETKSSKSAIVTQFDFGTKKTQTGTTRTNVTKTGTSSTNSGKKKPRRPRNVSPKSRKTAVLLGIFFGFLSAHRFYLKKPKTALIQLVVVYSGIFLMQENKGAVIFVLWPIIDIILILTGSFKDFKGRKVLEW